MPSRSLPAIVNTCILLAVTVIAAVFFSSPLRAHGDLLPWAQDDFYYYLVVARNLTHHLGSTFDGTTPTNGYHPLYLLILWGAYRLAPSLRGIYRFLALLDTISAVAVFLAARALFARTSNRIWLNNAFALILTSFCVKMINLQMEVTLTLPLGVLFLLLLYRPPNKTSLAHWLLTGLVASLLVLSRLDTVLLVATCGLLAIIVPQYRHAMSAPKWLSFTAGFAPPILAYLAINRIFFHRLTPISGAAKQLRLAHGFAWHQLAIATFTPKAFLVISVCLLACLFWKRKTFARHELLVFTAALLFPILHWTLILSLSDWQLWPWYRYSERFTLLVILALACRCVRSTSPAPWLKWSEIALTAVSLLFLARFRYTPDQVMTDIARAARVITRFSENHPGRYAMGDRAGMVGYLSSQPILQTEGLMMDNAYLQHIARQEPLRDVLRLYHVDYYIGFSENRNDPHWKPVGPCFSAREPAQAGPLSLTMKGNFCEQPALQLIQPTGETMIFDLHPAPHAATSRRRPD